MTAPIIVARVELDALPEMRVHVDPDGVDAFLVIPTRDGTHIALHASSPDVPLVRLIAAIQEAQNTMRARRGPDQQDADFWSLIESYRDDLAAGTETTPPGSPIAAITTAAADERERG